MKQIIQSTYYELYSFITKDYAKVDEKSYLRRPKSSHLNTDLSIKFHDRVLG